MKIPSARASFTASVVSDEEAKMDPGSEPRLSDMMSASCEILHHLIACETISSWPDFPEGPKDIATDREISGAAPINDPLDNNIPDIKVPCELSPISLMLEWSL